MSDPAVPAAPKKRGRPVGSYAKKLVYVRFFSIMFMYQSMMFVYCCPVGYEKPTFLPLEKVPYNKMADIGLLTWDKREDAVAAIKQIPYFEMGNNPVELEVVSNANQQFAELVLPCEAKEPPQDEPTDSVYDIYGV